MSKIQRVSFIFRVLFQITFVIVLALHFIFLITGPKEFNIGTQAHFVSFTSVIPENLQSLVTPQLDFMTRLWAFLIGMLPVVADLMILYFLIKLFKLYERKQIFDINNACYLRNIGYALIAREIIEPIYQFCLSIILTHGKSASIALSNANIGIILLALLIIFNSWIMAEGYRLQEEQQLTV